MVLTKSLISFLMTEGSWKAIPNQLVLLRLSCWGRFRFVGVCVFEFVELDDAEGIILVDRVVVELNLNWLCKDDKM